MGLFDSLFGSGKTKSKSKSETTQNTDRTTIAKSTTEQNTFNKADSTTKLLRDDVQNTLNDFLLNLVGQNTDGTTLTPDEQLKQLGTFLVSRAEGAENALNAQTGAILNEARRSGQREVDRLQTDLAQAAGGSTANSFVLGATAEAQAALESQLAAAAAGFAQQNRGVATAEFQNAIDALSSGIAGQATSTQAISQLVNVLRGATQTTTATETGQNVTEVNAEETVKELIKALTTGSSTVKDGKGLIQRIGESFASFRG